MSPTIDHSLSDSEVESSNKEHKQESGSCKLNEECQVVVVRAVDAVGNSTL